ncbi:hypothetical protein HMPREF2955_11775 [Prevotella sp. HMSC073D09]|nr:hypothetical protein HMPREF2955_11775 [Prevotella sp. HMSC073D09]
MLDAHGVWHLPKRLQLEIELLSGVDRDNSWHGLDLTSLTRNRFVAVDWDNWWHGLDNKKG